MRLGLPTRCAAALSISIAVAGSARAETIYITDPVAVAPAHVGSERRYVIAEEPVYVVVPRRYVVRASYLAPTILYERSVHTQGYRWVRYVDSISAPDACTIEADGIEHCY